MWAAWGKHLRRPGQYGFAVRSVDTVPFNYPERTSVDVMCGDVRDPTQVELAMRGVSCVVLADCAPAQGSRLA